MKFAISFLLIASLSFVSQQFMPWWSLVIVAFVISWLMGMRSWQSFLSGFLAIFITWGAYAIFLHQGNAGILTDRMANLLPFAGSSILLILGSAVFGGFMGGLGAATGSLGRDWLAPVSKPRNRGRNRKRMRR